MTSLDSPDDAEPNESSHTDSSTDDAVSAPEAPVAGPEAVREPVEPVEPVEVVEPAGPVEPAEVVEPVEPAVVIVSPRIGDSAAGGTPPSALPPPPAAAGSATSAPASGDAGATADAGKDVRGIVTGVEVDELAVTLEDGRAAVLARRNWDLVAVEDLTAIVSLGDRIEAAVLARDDPQQRVVLSRAWSIKRKAWGSITEALESHTSVKARVVSASAKGLVVDVAGLRGFVPASHLSLDNEQPDTSGFVGQVMDLRVLEADPKKERLVLSLRSLLLREQRRETHELLTRLEVGHNVKGTVAQLSDYGAFVDLGGVKGLVHLSELSWQRVGHPREVLAVGDEVEVRVLDVKVKKRRVSLSLRQTQADPLGTLQPGTVVSGPVSRLVDFGAFVDLGGVEGLVHLSELAEYRVSAPEEIVTPGETVMVKILSVDKRRRRIELSIRQAVSDHYGQ